jgi:type IV pilus assembly protein PilE
MSLQHRAPAHHFRGFSLIELMVVVAIAAILFAIAVPSYMTYIRQARRADAKTAVLDLAAREERWLTTNPAGYTTATNSLGYTPAAFPVTVNPNGYYTLTVCIATNAGTTPACDPNPNPPTAPSFYITATPVAGLSQANDAQCTSFSVDSLGAQFATGSQTSAFCWAN